MRALQALGGGKSAVIDDAPIPELRPDYITVQTIAVGKLMKNK